MTWPALHLLVLSSVLVPLVACVEPPPPPPDRPDACSVELVLLRVKVVDAEGAPVEGAVVTARNEGSGKTLIGTTDARGATLAVNEEIGDGAVEVQAERAPKTSPAVAVGWTCDACHCYPSTAELTLALDR
ncbi:carboxypeptidase regulatory-like domain-containing protein [Aggregicoccus sp. 17bor-14]|uniref:carboxypeptidase regulatory-like domain-containing protein n=1 Tax=Myxococcaceae TaxID=31 RepID=UPI00129D0EE6|nr:MULTISPECIES: carboxypeptidase regulatory-like domain-containing protein [Myxococcaceae]MBF5041501.1 carboxypeptidase regulatory-like domain-containing protein [Simulacricoccus sp. 17bor-14]MRI87285.1 carboxypeptidase regulatory-like domain-containing protein [Aggregicoccus sp. 17bor-14]